MAADAKPGAAGRDEGGGAMPLTDDERLVLTAAATGRRVSMAIVGPGSAQRVAIAVGELHQRGLIWDQQVALGVYYWRATEAGVEAWESE